MQHLLTLLVGGKKILNVPKENKFYLKVVFFIIFSVISCGSNTDSEYFKIKKENNTEKLNKFYSEKRISELEKIFSELDKIFNEKKDKKISEYLKNKSYGNYRYNIVKFYAAKIADNCENGSCRQRLTDFFENIYSETDDIELFSEILEYEEVLGKTEYERIRKICIEKNSLEVLKEQKYIKDNKEIGNDGSKEIKISNKRYRVMQSYDLTTDNLRRILLITDEENLYLLKDEDILKISGYYYSIPDIRITDLNNDGNDEVIVGYDKNILVYTVTEKEIIKIFNGYEDIPLSNYFVYEIDSKNIKTIIKDDFKNEKTEVENLPNEKEIVSQILRDKDNRERKLYYDFILIKDKFILNVMNRYVYEIIFDKNLSHKVKIIKKSEI